MDSTKGVKPNEILINNSFKLFSPVAIDDDKHFLDGNNNACSINNLHYPRIELLSKLKNKYSFKEILSSLKKIKPRINFYKKLIKIVEDEFEIENTEVNICENGYFLIFKIRIPKITISNSSELSRDIFGFYIKFKIEILYDDIVKLQFFRGLKTDFTQSEYIDGYIHSHISWENSETIEFKDFCTGSGGFRDIYNSLNRERRFDNFINDFEIFVISIMPFLSWESTEGTPYRYISHLSRYEAKPNAYLSNRAMLELEQDKKFDKCKELVASKLANGKMEADEIVIDECNYLKITTESISKAIEEEISNFQKIHKIDGIYYKEKTVKNISRVAISIEDYYFKGKKLKAKFIEDVNQEEFPDKYLTTNPGYAMAIAESINKDFINYQYLNYGVKRAKI